MPLTPKRRSELRAQAHKLDPVVIIGDKGLTDEVLTEIDRSLKAHELIKVRAATADRDAREVFFEKICEALRADEVQQIGKILVLFRESETKNEERRTKNEEKPKPAPKRRLRASGSALDAAKGSGRRQSRTPSPRPESEPRRRRPRSSR